MSAVCLAGRRLAFDGTGRTVARLVEQITATHHAQAPVILSALLGVTQYGKGVLCLHKAHLSIRLQQMHPCQQWEVTVVESVPYQTHTHATGVPAATFRGVHATNCGIANSKRM